MAFAKGDCVAPTYLCYFTRDPKGVIVFRLSLENVYDDLLIMGRPTRP